MSKSLPLFVVPNVYEELRAQNIRRNKEQLAALGLDVPITLPPASGKKRRITDPSEVPTLPPRSKLPRACRDPHAAATAVAISDVPKAATNTADRGLPEYIQQAFARDEAVPATSTAWSRSNHHQHVTVAPSGRTIATTGCAGYGVALAHRVPKVHRLCPCVSSSHVVITVRFALPPGALLASRDSSIRGGWFFCGTCLARLAWTF